MAEAYFSDDSELYGDKDYTRKLELRNKPLDVQGYWENHAKDINVIAYSATKTQEEIEALKALSRPQIPKGGLHNSYEGEESAWQLHETVDDFLARVPVLTSAHMGPWLWVANPYHDRETEPERSSAVFVQKAPRLLEAYLETKRKTAEQNPNAAPATITRKLGPDREKLKTEILDMAKEHGMTCGKWMLFPSEETATEVWKKVVTATIEGHLGIAAKIASESLRGDARLICVYTKDFSDAEDIKRVVLQLRNMQLLPDEASNRGIYYKCDAYTYLGIESDNPYGLKASLFGSRDVLAEKVEAKGKRKAPATQKRIADFITPQSSAKRRK